MGLVYLMFCGEPDHKVGVNSFVNAILRPHPR